MGAVYGAFAGAIVLVGWLWLTSVALLLGAELNAEIEREKQLAEGGHRLTRLNRPHGGRWCVKGRAWGTRAIALGLA